MKGSVVIFAIVIGAAALASPTSATEHGVLVLFDFGDGTYEWVEVPPLAENRTALRATERASEVLGLPPIEVTWYAPPLGALVDDIGNRNPAWPQWWHFFLWNATARSWELSDRGASAVNVTSGAIAWYLTVDDPETYVSPRPIPTPDFPRVWTSFRGDARNRGEAQGTIPTSVFVGWDRDVGVLEIDTTPVVAYGRVFVGTRNALLALDSDTGREVWRNPQVRSLLSTPAVYDGKLIVGGTDGRLHAVDAATGAAVWSLVLETGTLSTGIASSPTVHDGRAYVGVFNEDEGGMGAVVAVNLNNGTVAWRYETASVHMSRPAIADGVVYVGVMGIYNGTIGYDPPHGLLALNLDGTLRRFDSTAGEVASSPVVARDRVFVTSKDGHLYAFGPVGELWRRSIGVSTSSPALVRDRLYVGSGALDGTGRLYAFTMDGVEQWSATVGGAVQASIVSDGELVCAATNVARGQHVCSDATDGTTIWTHTPLPEQYILGSPVVVGTTVYAVSDNGHVYALVPSSVESPMSGFPGAAIAFVVIVAVAVAGIAVYLWRRGPRNA